MESKPLPSGRRLARLCGTAPDGLDQRPCSGGRLSPAVPAHRDGAIPVASGRGGSAGDPCRGLHRRQPGLRTVGAADPPPSSGGCESGGPGWRVLRPQRAGRDGSGPGRIGVRVARTDDGREVVEPDDAGAVHVGAVGVARSRGQVLRE